MIILQFYRFYISVLTGGFFYYGILNKWWVWIGVTTAVRTLWLLIEHKLDKLKMKKMLKMHEFSFKQQFGPYGIRIINKVQTDPVMLKSLCEIFTPNIKKLKETVSQLEVMDTLFKAGMRPEGDMYLLHDLKMKYGKYRLENEKNENES